MYQEPVETMQLAFIEISYFSARFALVASLPDNSY